jgi:dipeptidyl aminopeptidase/acylaminoacyl peptidase
MRYCLVPVLFLFSVSAFCQSGDLTVEKIMRDPKWIGTSPSNPQWSHDSRTLFFNWNPTRSLSDSTYYISLSDRKPRKSSTTFQQEQANARTYNRARNSYVFVRDNDIFYTNVKGETKRLTHTTDTESNPVFANEEKWIVYTRSQNLYAWVMITGETVQLTNFRSAEAVAARPEITRPNPQEQWLREDQLRNFEVLRDRKERTDSANAFRRSQPRSKELRTINIEDKTLQGLTISPDARFISYRLTRPIPATQAKTTIIPNYVTETGFTTDIPGRTKVGSQQSNSEYYIYDRSRDTVILLKFDSIPGIRDLPDYVKDYPKLKADMEKKNGVRAVNVFGPFWSPAGRNMIFDIRSHDNKDRWIMKWDTASGKLTLVDRQRDEAWIAGPGISFPRIGWINENTLWYQSEATGYSHIYTYDLGSGSRKALTSGNFEVQQASLSRDLKTLFIVTNEVHPGEQHFYHLDVSNGKKTKITGMTGAHQVTVSPDEKNLAILYSYSTKPWELFLMENKVNGKTEQVTNLAQSDEFKSYVWQDPEVISFSARDGKQVYARVYKPANPHPNKPAVIFVHGAGYLQNAHKWWSSYFREFMFNNLLASRGYYVMDIDFRASSGYGRDWRTGIYRFMGGKDLDDNVDAAKYLVQKFTVDPRRIGVYGGSYGGFITLMGMFNEPDVFAAGAALRPVTDWANYNHGYTSNILNEPHMDSIAYRNSSPYYYAEGLKGHLLICHGMIDVNVHFQDAVKLAQKLIELGKDNWELAGYPLEDHAFIEPSSWTDEYKRILKLFETVLKK